MVRWGLMRPEDVDSRFGPRTEKATITFQIQRGLKPDGVVGKETFASAATSEPPVVVYSDELFDQRWHFLQAANYKHVTTPRTVSLIPMHTMEAPEKPDTAEGVASWFHGARGKPPDASAHVCGDGDSIVQCVKPNDVAWGAQGGNSISYHCEQAGYASWSRDKWLTANNLAMLKLMASHVHLALAHFKLPAVALTDDDVAACVRDSLIAQGRISGALSGVVGGICEHRQLTHVWQQWARYGLPDPRKEPKPFWPTHVDCGDGYPMDVFLDLVKVHG